MTLSTIWYHRFQILINYKIFAKCEKVRFIEKVGKLGKFVILSQDATPTGCTPQLGNVKSEN